MSRILDTILPESVHNEGLLFVPQVLEDLMRGKLDAEFPPRLDEGDDPASVSSEPVRTQLEDVAEYREILDKGRHVVLCHYPILAFRDHYFGWYHLYGHVHASYEWNVTENARRLLQRLYVRDDVCRMYNVGAMIPVMAYTPRSLEEITGTSPEGIEGR